MTRVDRSDDGEEPQRQHYIVALRSSSNNRSDYFEFQSKIHRHSRITDTKKMARTIIKRRATALMAALLVVILECVLLDTVQSWAPILVKKHHLTYNQRTWVSVTKDPYFGEETEDEEDDDESLDWFDGQAELVADEGDNDDDADWIPDREQARRRRAQSYQTAAASPSQQQVQDAPPPQGSMYTEEEEALIAAMGGKFRDSPSSKREDGFLGDSTLQEIATDYSVPVCYLADVLVMWGTPVPINIHDRLGDLVTGEQAFALVEAIYSLDISALHDRYSNQSLMSVCDDYDIDLKDAFEMAMKEGWSLPFGVQTCLRVEQEEELIRVLGAI